MKINDNILQVLSASKVIGNELHLQGQLDRKMYMDVNKVIEAAGGKWSRKATCHIFEQDAEERIDQIILSGEVEIPKDEFSYFPSPPAVVDKLLELAEITEGMVILEPSAGKGAIAFACVAEGAEVHCIEWKSDNYNFLRDSCEFSVVTCADFLEIKPIIEWYDRVIMNPPFEKQADIKHVMHAHKFLKPDGLLVSVMSAGVLFRSDRRTTEFRAFVESKGGHFEKLPDGSFKGSGTMVSSCVVSIPA